MQAELPKTKAAQVREMFGRIAPRYDLLNHLLSFNIDRRWRRKTVEALAAVLAQPDAKVLDLCCGTADLALALLEGARADVFGLDFSHPMLIIARRKGAARSGGMGLAEGDALHLPFADHQFDAVTIAFGLRNLVDRDHGLGEIRRVLKPGGYVAILEFSQPVRPILKSLFQLYFRVLLPRIGGAVSGSRSAYQYLHDTVQVFPTQVSLVEMIEAAGFAQVQYRNLSGGIAALHTGRRV